jgi:P4 family phage/plasmid primase-like protien
MPKSRNDIKNFVKFMKSHYAQKGGPITHTLMGPLADACGEYGRGSFYIDGTDYDIFLRLYKEAVRYCNMHLVERPKDIGPLILDFDFHLDQKYKERQYLDSHIERTVKIFNKLIYKYCNVRKEDIKAFVTEKPDPTCEIKKDGKKTIKDGFHILYPDIALDTQTRYFFLDEAKRIAQEKELFEDIPFTNADGYDDIFDSSVIINNGFLLFGSHKEGRDPYALTKIYNYDLTYDLIDNYEDDDLVDVLSLRRHPDEDVLEIREKYNNNKMLKKMEEVAASYSKKKKSELLKKKFDEKEDKIHDIKKRLLKAEKESNPSDVELARNLAEVLSEKRASSYTTWINVGWALHNISKNLFDAFVSFSKKDDDGFDLAGCEKVWSEARDEGYGMASLDHWAREDNYEDYIKVLRKARKQFSAEAENGTHNDIANFVYEVHKYNYKCVSIIKNIWLEFQNDRWVFVEDGYTLSERISNEVAKEFCAQNAYYLHEESCKQDIDKETMHNKSQNMIRTFSKLKDYKFSRDILKSCSRKFYDKKFESRLNTNPDIIGFENGVFDLKHNCFRRGVPEDMLTMSTGYDYEEFDDDDPEVLEVMKYFETVQQEDDMREYILRFISSFFDGYVRDQKFVLWTGSGCHSKDTLIKAVKINKSSGRIIQVIPRKIQDIKLDDYVLGNDGRARKVSAVYNGVADMFRITTMESENVTPTSFDVNGAHRLALRSHFRPIISKKTYGGSDRYFVTYHELINNSPMAIEKEFRNLADVRKFVIKLKTRHNVVQYGEVIPVSVNTWLDLIEYEKNMQENILEHYKLFKIGHNEEHMMHDKLFTVTRLDKGEFFGVEIDGNKQYVMNNGFVTYNSNGKSTTVDLIRNTMGEYFGILPVTVLTRKRGNASGATPELADKNGKRFLVIQEPEHDDTVYVGQMKELTGGDTIVARALYGNPFEYKPQFKIILICNKLPLIPSNDGGTWRRLRVVPWESRFVDKPKEKNEFKKDGMLTEKMKKWGPAFANILLTKYYPRYAEHGIDEPPKVTQYSDQYQKNSDYYYEFLTGAVDITGDEEDSEKITVLYEMFKKFYSNDYNGKAPLKKELVEYISKRREFKIIGDTVVGVRAKYGNVMQDDD